MKSARPVCLALSFLKRIISILRSCSLCWCSCYPYSSATFMRHPDTCARFLMHRQNYPAAAFGAGLLKRRPPVLGSALDAADLLLGEGMKIAMRSGRK